MSKTIIKWDSNWADEMDIQGFVIVDAKAAKEFKEQLETIKNEIIIGVGTNEDIEYANGKEMLSDLTFEDLTEDESESIVNVIGDEYGHCSFYQEWWNEDD
jgi:hypothetical protein